VMMKYKIMTIAVASLLPLGFAATASAGTEASHGVTFTVAEARSISVVVNEDFKGDNGELEFGAIGESDSIELADAVKVTVSTPGDPEDNIRIQLQDPDTEFGTPLESGVTLTANAGAISSGDGTSQGDVDLDGSANEIYMGLSDPRLLATFDVVFTLTTVDASPEDNENKSYLIQYDLNN